MSPTLAQLCRGISLEIVWKGNEARLLKVLIIVELVLLYFRDAEQRV